MIKSITTEVEVNLNGECRMAAFARGVNRGVNNCQVTKLAERMLSKGYRRGEVVQVMRAEDALTREAELQLVDQWGESVKAEDAALYYFVMDGQHRVLAAAEANAQLHAEGKEPITVPAVEVELCEGESISQYVYEINATKEAWSTADYALSAQNAQQSPLLERYAALMKSKSNPEGLTLTVLNRMYCANEKAMSGADFKALCEGRTVKGRKQKSILPVFNLSRGNDIHSVCLDAGLSNRDMNRKFVLDTFCELELTHDRQVALNTFALAKKEEVDSLRGKRGTLDGERFAQYMRDLAAEVVKMRDEEKMDNAGNEI